jgi:hypothetical protein
LVFLFENQKENQKNCGESAISLWEICFFFKKQLFFIKTALTGPLVYPRGRDPQGRRQRLKSIIKLNVEEFDCRRKNSRALPGTEYQTGLRELPNRVSVAPWYSTEQSVGCSLAFVFDLRSRPKGRSSTHYTRINIYYIYTFVYIYYMSIIYLDKLLLREYQKVEEGIRAGASTPEGDIVQFLRPQVNQKILDPH